MERKSLKISKKKLLFPVVIVKLHIMITMGITMMMLRCSYMCAIISICQTSFTEEHCSTFSIFFRAWVRSVQQPNPRHASPGHHSSVRCWGQWRVRIQQHSGHRGGGTRVWNPGGWFNNDWPSSYIILLLHVKHGTENLWPYDIPPLQWVSVSAEMIRNWSHLWFSVLSLEYIII